MYTFEAWFSRVGSRSHSTSSICKPCNYIGKSNVASLPRGITSRLFEFIPFHYAMMSDIRRVYVAKLRWSFDLSVRDFFRDRDHIRRATLLVFTALFCKKRDCDVHRYCYFCTLWFVIYTRLNDLYDSIYIFPCIYVFFSC